MFVGARSASIEASWGSTLDADGDGFADVLAGAPDTPTYAGNAFLYFGAKSGPSAPFTITNPVGANGFFGSSVD